MLKLSTRQNEQTEDVMDYDTNCPWWGQESEGISLACKGQCTCGPVATSSARQYREHKRMLASAKGKSKFHTDPAEPR